MSNILTYTDLAVENENLKREIRELAAQNASLSVENCNLKLRVAELEALEANKDLAIKTLNELYRSQYAKNEELLFDRAGKEKWIYKLVEEGNSVLAERDKLQSECDQLRNRPFECWSNDDGDSWCEHPADSEFVGGLKVGDTFELLAGYDSVRVKYVVTKAPDDVDDEYEVEQAK